MKVLGLILVLSLSVLVMVLLLLPFGVTMSIRGYPNDGFTTLGKARVGEIDVQNNGWFSQYVQLPEITGCIGDQEVPLDAWMAAGSSVVQGTGQLRSVKLRPGEKGTVYLVATDSSLHENMQLFYRTEYFSCLNPGKKV